LRAVISIAGGVYIAWTVSRICVYCPKNNSHLSGIRVAAEATSIWMAMRFFDLTQKC